MSDQYGTGKEGLQGLNYLLGYCRGHDHAFGVQLVEDADGFEVERRADPHAVGEDQFTVYENATVTPEIVHLFTEVLRSLGHVEVAVLSELEGHALVGAGNDGLLASDGGGSIRGT